MQIEKKKDQRPPASAPTTEHPGSVGTLGSLV